MVFLFFPYGEPDLEGPPPGALPPFWPTLWLVAWRRAVSTEWRSPPVLSPSIGSASPKPSLMQDHQLLPAYYEQRIMILGDGVVCEKIFICRALAWGIRWQLCGYIIS